MKRFFKIFMIVAVLAITLTGGISLKRVAATSHILPVQTVSRSQKVGVVTHKHVDQAKAKPATSLAKTAKTASTASTADTATTAVKGRHLTKHKGHHYRIVAGKPGRQGHPGQKGTMGSAGSKNENGYAATAPTASTASTAGTASTAKTAKSLVEVK